MTRIRKKAAGNRGAPKLAVPAKVTGIKPGRNATINDIARLASVSKKTVSRVINQSPLVQEATRARIQAVIDKFGYVPDPRTILKGVYKLPPAHTLVCVRNGPAKQPAAYWDVAFEPVAGLAR